MKNWGMGWVNFYLETHITVVTNYIVLVTDKERTYMRVQVGRSDIYPFLCTCVTMCTQGTYFYYLLLCYLLFEI